MGNLLSSLSAVLSIGICLIFGIIFKKTKLLTEDGNQSIKNVVVNLMLPALLVKVFMTASYTFDIIKVVLTVFLVCSLLLFLFSLWKKDKILKFLMTGFEAGMLGYSLFAIIFTAFPEADISKFAVLDLGQVIFVFTIYKFFLSKSDNAPFSKNLKEMAKSPVLISIAVGIILGLFGVQNLTIATPILSVLEFVSAPISLLVLLTVGFDLNFTKNVIKKASGYAVLRLFVMALAAGLVYLVIFLTCDNPTSYILPLCLLFALPAPFVLPIFQKDKEGRELAATALSVQTLLFLVLAMVFVAVTVL